MKNNLLFMVLVLAGCSAQAQKDAPEIVQTNFKKMFSNAEKIKYSKETDGTYEIDFVQNAIKSSANFTETGEWRETEQAIKEKDLPKSITDMLATEYKDWDVEECQKVQVPAKEMFYEMIIEKGKENFELKVDVSGKVFEKKEAKESESDDKE